MIALHHIVKKGKNKDRYLLDHINLNINKGEFLAITYSDDESMTALLKILSLNDSDFYGEYYLENCIIKKEDSRKTQGSSEIGLILDHLNLIDHLTIEENISLPLYPQNLTIKQKEERQSQLLNFLKIGHLINNYPNQLNNYLRFKAAVAQSLMLNPKIVMIGGIMDKISPEEKIEALDLLSQLNNDGLTIVISLPKTEAINPYHRVFHLHDGKLILQTD